MPELFDQNGVQFYYPDNWTVSEEASQEATTITLETPKTGFMNFVVYDKYASPQQLIDNVLQSLEQEYENVEYEPNPELEEVAYEVFFYCMNMVVSAVVQAWREESRSIVVLYQAESREFDEMRSVFEAIVFSLRGAT